MQLPVRGSAPRTLSAEAAVLAGSANRGDEKAHPCGPASQGARKQRLPAACPQRVGVHVLLLGASGSARSLRPAQCGPCRRLACRSRLQYSPADNATSAQSGASPSGSNRTQRSRGNPRMSSASPEKLTGVAAAAAARGPRAQSRTRVGCRRVPPARLARLSARRSSQQVQIRCGCLARARAGGQVAPPCRLQRRRYRRVCCRAAAY